MTKIFEVPLYPYRRSADQDASRPARHPVVIVGAGPVGLAAAIDLALRDIPVVVLDENDKVSWGSRAICFAKRPLEIPGLLSSQLIPTNSRAKSRSRAAR
jgi:3-(3-hydroxy-phenyl)propionate hydroxylase